MTKKRPSRKSRRNNEALAGSPEPVLVPNVLPVLAAKDMVAFPGVMMSLYLSRSESIRAMESAMGEERLAFVVTQKNPDVENPKGRDLHKMGVVAHIVRTLQVPDGRVKVLLQGLVRARAKKYEGKKFLSCRIEPLPAPAARRVSAENQAIINRIRENLQVLVEYEHLPRRC